MKANVLRIRKDGNCLFGSLVHQLFFNKINSNRHNEFTLKLRADVVEYIQKNVHDFTNAIWNRTDYKGEKTVEGCLEFVSNDLSISGFWGGSETFIAVSKIYEVNILVFHEKGPFYFATGFSSENKRSLLLAYREGGINRNNERIYNHYDTMCGLNEELLYKCATELAEKMNRKVDLTC